MHNIAQVYNCALMAIHAHTLCQAIMKKVMTCTTGIRRALAVYCIPLELVGIYHKGTHEAVVGWKCAGAFETKNSEKRVHQAD